MNDKTFVDTNILIYAHDVDAKAKHEVAKSVLRELWSQRTGVLSMQVPQEFYLNVTRKIVSASQRCGAVGGQQLLPLVHRDHARRNRVSISNRGRIPDRVLGCSDCCLGRQIRSNANSLGRLESSADDRGTAGRKPVRATVTSSHRTAGTA